MTRRAPPAWLTSAGVAEVNHTVGDPPSFGRPRGNRARSSAGSVPSARSNRTLSENSASGGKSRASLDTRTPVPSFGVSVPPVPMAGATAEPTTR